LSILDDFYKNLNKKNNDAVAIAIPAEGEPLIEILDEKTIHFMSFRKIAMKLEFYIPENYGIFRTIYFLRDRGIVTVQIRDGLCVVIFPDSITESQYNYLEFELSKYSNLEYQTSNSKIIEGFISRDDTLEYAKGLIKQKQYKKEI